MLEEEADACSKQGNEYPFCSPTPLDNWENGTTHDFIWNYNYPYYVSSDTLSLYLYYYIKFEYVFIKKYTSISTTTGGLTVTVDDSWFLPSSNNVNKTLTIYGYYLPSQLNSTQELTNTYSMYPRPFNFTVTQFANNNNNNSNNPTVHPAGPNNQNSSSDLPGWAIAIIVIAILALFCGLGALLWIATLSRKQQKEVPEKPEPKVYPDDTMNSQARLLAFRSNDSVPSTETYVSPPEPSKLASTNPNIMFLTDTLRHYTQEEERKRLGQVLLQKQLEQDGTLVKHAGHRVADKIY